MRISISHTLKLSEWRFIGIPWLRGKVFRHVCIQFYKYSHESFFKGYFHQNYCPQYSKSHLEKEHGKTKKWWLIQSITIKVNTSQQLVPANRHLTSQEIQNKKGEQVQNEINDCLVPTQSSVDSSDLTEIWISIWTKERR